MTVVCPVCGKYQQVSPDLAGEHVRCPGCGAGMVAPAASDSVLSAVTSSPAVRAEADSLGPVQDAELEKPLAIRPLARPAGSCAGTALGALALVLGVAALPIAVANDWLLGACFAGLGALLGLGGIFTAILGCRGRGFGVSFAGAAVCVGALFTAVVFLGGGASAGGGAQTAAATQGEGIEGRPGGARQAEDPRRHHEAAFSYVPPEGWAVRAFPGLKYKAAVGPAAAGFAPNMNIVDEPFAGPLDAYAEVSQASVQRLFKDCRVLKKDDFKATDGLRGVRIVIEAEQRGRRLRQTFYVFGNGTTKFVVTCSALAEGGDRLDPVFEASMKTFRFDTGPTR